MTISTKATGAATTEAQVSSVSRWLRRGVTALVLAGGLAAGTLVATPAATAATSTAAAGTYDNGSAAIRTKGTWTTQTSSSAEGGTLAVLNAKGEATLTFTGSSASWLTRRSPYSGIADVYVDGKKKASVDLYAATTTYRVEGYRVTGLNGKTHTLRIVRTGKKNVRSTGSGIVLDAVNVSGPAAPAAPSGLQVSATRTGASLTWTASPQRDVTAYRVYRSAGSEDTLVATTAKPGFVNDGLGAGRYSYSVSAVDAVGNVSPRSAAVTFTVAADQDSPLRYADCPSATVSVKTAGQLQSALASAGPGTVVRLAPGRYRSVLVDGVHGTPASPVWLCGSRAAVVDGGSASASGGVKIVGSSDVVVAGFTVTGSQKGVSVLSSDSVTVADLLVQDIGQEGVHFKNDTTSSTLVGTVIDHTGLETGQYGEGVYVGTDKNNWCLYNDCKPDATNDIRLLDNTISRTAAEPIEVKEGTNGGLVSGNTIFGAGTAPAPWGGRLIAVKGHGLVVTGNVGHDSGDSGVQILSKGAGYGTDNIVYANTFDGVLTGFGVRVNDGALDNVVGCDNVVAKSAHAVTNQTCQR